MTVTIYVEDVQGRQEVRPAGETLASTLASLRLPHTMFQAYLVHPGDDLLPIPHWTRLDVLDRANDQVLVRALRNTLFDTILPTSGAGTGEVVSGAGFEQIVPGENGRDATWKQVALGPRQAQRLVVDEVGSFLRTHDTATRGCVFGVSGGGDSNALAYGLSQSLPHDKIVAFTLVFRDVMTQAAADRATILCQDLGINHEVIQPVELARLLDIRTSLDALYDDFSSVFGTEALHFFGTFLILKTARTLAQRHGLHDLAFGYNREDLLAELLFMVVNGRRPLSYPTRSLGEQRIVMPVWRIPKLVLDACHPRFSLENYRERDAHTTRQRSLAFYLGHTLDSSYPSFGLSLLDGMQRAFGDSFSQLTYDSDLDVYVTELADESRRDVVGGLLRRHFGQAGD
ncbi:hypothetical protein [Arsenicicoccus bolidensis]|uniref:hypothetical protein n=1 Tax=Arsenicicoccus bolidensis TaxID=229480 RepID=UPI0028B0FA9B|nr:hypothetical protein [Arsenicicoccus bolidensis]